VTVQLNELTAAELLALTEVGPDHFQSRHSQNNQIGALFGGQMLAQTLAAASRTVSKDWLPHSLTGYFHRAGTLERPLELSVERVRDGRQYAARHVRASQNATTVFDALCSFQAPEDGVQHQFADLGSVPGPHELLSEREFLAAHADLLPARIAELFARRFPVEIRPVDPERRFRGVLDQPLMDTWMRYSSAGELSSTAEQAMLIAFMSDFRFGPVVSAVHVAPQAAETMFLTTLSHSIVFHAPARADHWLLHRMESPWAGNGRGLARGQMFDEGGRLVASTTQETVFRLR
jgi:acyl-CoA thioesterase II